MAHRVLNSSTQENRHLAKQKRARPRGEIELIDLTWVCLQLNCCCDSQSIYSYNRSFPSRPRFPVKHSVLCKYNTYYVTNCSTEVGEHPILFFLFFVEESNKRAVTIACPCRKYVGGYNAGVCVNTNICLTHAPQWVARGRIVPLFLQLIVLCRVRLHDDFIQFSVSRVPLDIFLLGCSRSPEIRNPPNFRFQEFGISSPIRYGQGRFLRVGFLKKYFGGQGQKYSLKIFVRCTF